MNETYAEALGRRASQYKPPDQFLAQCAKALRHADLVEAVVFEAYDCLGSAEDMRAILARVCEPKRHNRGRP